MLNTFKNALIFDVKIPMKQNIEGIQSAKLFIDCEVDGKRLKKDVVIKKIEDTLLTDGDLDNKLTNVFADLKRNINSQKCSEISLNCVVFMVQDPSSFWKVSANYAKPQNGFSNGDTHFNVRDIKKFRQVIDKHLAYTSRPLNDQINDQFQFAEV